jgi:hypothetical protein
MSASSCRTSWIARNFSRMSSSPILTEVWNRNVQRHR